MFRIRSTSTGSAQPDRNGVATGIAKAPVPHIQVRDPGSKAAGLGSGVVGDFIGDRRHHGGSAQAVYAFAREELDGWEQRLRRTLPDGMFGENLTTMGYDVDAALVGEQWQVGPEVVLEVTGPRIPCATFAARMGERGWVRTFAAHGRSGAYLLVQQPGRITAGDPCEVLRRPAHGITVPLTFRALMGDRKAAEQVLAAQVLTPVEHTALEQAVRRRA